MLSRSWDVFIFTNSYFVLQFKDLLKLISGGTSSRLERCFIKFRFTQIHIMKHKHDSERPSMVDPFFTWPCIEKLTSELAIQPQNITYSEEV